MLLRRNDYFFSRARLSAVRHVAVVLILLALAVSVPVYIYKQRVREIAIRRISPFARQTYKVEWLHIPKCGTSLGETLLSYFCGVDAKGIVHPGKVERDRIPEWCLAKFRTDQHHRQDWIIGDHFTLNNYTDSQIRKVYTMIRNPGVRVVSGFHFLTQFKRPNSTSAEICNYVLRNQKKGHVALGGQTKYIIGSPVRANAGKDFANVDIPSNLDVEHACSLLETMAFVGITDFWETSSCILAASIGKVHKPTTKMRPNPHKIPIKSVECGQDPDWALYRCAWSRMVVELERYSTCRATFWSEFMSHGAM